MVPRFCHKIYKPTIEDKVIRSCLPPAKELKTFWFHDGKEEEEKGKREERKEKRESIGINKLLLTLLYNWNM